MKKKVLIICGLAMAVACSKGDYKDSTLSPEQRAELLLKEMTLEEKIGQMCMYAGPGYVSPGQGAAQMSLEVIEDNIGTTGLAEKLRGGKIGSFLHVLSWEEASVLQKLAGQSRLGIPLLMGIDAIHGNGLHKGCTVYPTSITMASSFNPDMMEKIGDETAAEMRACGMAWTFNPNLDVARDARWGRMGETFGEDTYLVTEMGKRLIMGLQGRDGVDSLHVLACAKHMIGGGEPMGGINAAPMDMSERKMRELYLPPFIAAIKEAGVATVMAAHNELNGVPCHANGMLLKDLLRDELGFDGIVVSDWMDIEKMVNMHHYLPTLDEAFKVSVEEGIDVHMQGDNYFESILDGVKSGRISEKRIDFAVSRILEAKFALGLFENCRIDVDKIQSSRAGHKETALQAAREGIVLLKNDGILPLNKDKYKKIFVVGPNADSQTILGDWAVTQDKEDVVTVLDGIRSACPKAVVKDMCFGGKILSVTSERIKEARREASSSDLNIVVVGENSERYAAFGRTCGENCDRDSLDLPGLQQQLLEAVVGTGNPTVLVLLNGRALSLVWADKNVSAIVEAWEPGMMGGKAIAEILFGDVNPSGKLPVTVPYNVGQVQTVYNHKHSQYSRKFAMGPTGALYPFGYGLSYTTFEYGEPSLSADSLMLKDFKSDALKLSFTLTNTGNVDGTEVVQVYIRDEYGSVTRPVKELKAFRRVALKAGESTNLEFDLTPEMFECYGLSRSWAIEPGDFTILVGSSSADKDLKAVKFRVLR